jgi:tRNA (guanine37-N1)-methyltransferase
MKISILTLFPEMFQGPFELSIVKRAQEKRLIEINLINIRNFGIGKHKIVDDTPYGGGTGMILRPDVLHEAIQNTKLKINKKWKMKNGKNTEKVILLSASGKTYNQKKAKELAGIDHLILICGHYEGVDERIKNYIDEEISIGDYITTGGEIPSMLITDSITRLIPGVLKPGVTDTESFSLNEAEHQTYLEYPHYTKPLEYNGLKVPEVLLTGNHKKIIEWRIQQAEEKTKKIRPDLLKLTK